MTTCKICNKEKADPNNEYHIFPAWMIASAFDEESRTRNNEVIYTNTTSGTTQFFGRGINDEKTIKEIGRLLTDEEIISNKGIEFSIKEGKCLGLETQNDESIKLAQVKGYVLAVRKDSEFGHLRIKVRPDAQLDLEKLYRAIVEIDPKATWFYHASGKMLLNGSIKHRNQIASSLSLKSVIRLIEKLYN